MRYFVTIDRPGIEPLTLTKEAKNERRLNDALVLEFGGAAQFKWFDLEAALEPISERSPGRDHWTDADWEAEGRRIALDGMDLPDGAHCAMAEELGLDPY